MVTRPFGTSRARVSGKSRRIVGLEIGTSSIKLVVIEQRGEQFQVVKHLIQELPVTGEAKTVDRVGWLQAALKDVGATAVTLAIGGPEILIRRLKVPLMPAQELAEAAKWQLKDEMPFTVQEALVDVVVVGEIWDKDIKKLDVLAAVASKEYIRQQMMLVEQAGCRVERVVPSAVAMAAVVHQISLGHVERSIAILEMGATHTHVAILKDGMIRLTRELPIGSNHLTQSMVGVTVAASGTLDTAKAEAIKRQYGIIAEGAPGTTEEGLSLEQLSALMRSVLGTLVTEVARLLDFYRANLDDAGVDYLLICGGGALLKHLPAYLSEGLGLRVDSYHPSPPIADASRASFHEESARLVVALGAALPDPRGVDLRPRESASGRDQALAESIWKMGIKVLMIGGAVFACVAGLAAWHTQDQLRLTRQQWQQLEPIYQQTVAMSQEQQRLQGMLAAVRAFEDRQMPWDGVLKELGRLMPAAIELTELTASRTNEASVEFHLTGVVVGSGSEGSLAKFLEDVEQSVLFRAPRLLNSQTSMGPSATTTFEIMSELE